MDVIESKVSTADAAFSEIAANMQSLVGELRLRVGVVKPRGGQTALDKHRQRGKLFVRDRIDLLVDQDSPFLEPSPLAAWEMYDGVAPAAGLVTGIGRVPRSEQLLSSDARLS